MEEYADNPAAKCKLYAQDFLGAERGEVCAGCSRLGVKCLGCSHPSRPLAASQEAAVVVPAANYVFLKLEGMHEFEIVRSTSASEILSIAVAKYNVEGGKIYLLFDGDIAECPDMLDTKSRLCFRPQYYSLQCSYRTLSGTKSLRLVSKRIAKACGHGQNGIDGYCYRVDGLAVMVVVRSPRSSVLEQFLEKLKKENGICVSEDSVERKVEFGVLSRHFVVNESMIARVDVARQSHSCDP